MNFTYSIVPERELILVRVTGGVNYALFKLSLQYAWTRPDYNPAYSTLVDLREADVILSTPEMTSLINMLVETKLVKKARFSLVITKPFEAALAMIFESKLAQRMNTKVFSKLEDGAGFMNQTAKWVNEMLKDNSETISLDELKKEVENNEKGIS